MHKISHFLVYVYDANEWQETTLDDLAQVNEPEFNIIPVYSNGEYGKQTTWGEYQAAQAKGNEASQKHKKGFWQSVGNVLTADIAAPIKQQIQSEKQAAAAEKKPVREQDMPNGSYYYEVVTHSKYEKSRFDAIGFKNKINRLSQNGFRLAAFGTVSGLPSCEEAIEKAVWESFIGTDSSTTIQDYKIAVAIMEKQITREE